MINVIMLVVLLAATAVSVVLLIRTPGGTARMLRWTALALAVVPAAALTPYVVSDSGAAALYLLGVPVVAGTVPVLADLVGRAVTAADAVGAVVMAAWALLLALGIGLYFLPAAFLLFLALARDFAARTSRTP